MGPPQTSSTRRRQVFVLFAAAAAVMLGSAHLAPVGAAPTSPAAPGQVSASALSLGDRSPSVASWQRQLNLVAGQGLVVDGIFGPSTESATVNFQRFFGLGATGAVDDQSRDLMRFLLVLSQPGYTTLATFGDVSVGGFTNLGAYCFDIRDHPAFSLECSDVRSGQPISSQVIELGHPSVGPMDPMMVGTIDPIIASVQVDPIDAASVEAPITRDAEGLDRDLWVSPVRADDIAVVRALAGDGSEVRRIVVENSDDYLILELGDRGPAVATWQLQLNIATGAGLARNGVFGASTAAATRNFQRFFGLAADGIVGPNTRGVMAFVLATQPPEGNEPLGDPVSGDSASPGYPGSPPPAYLEDVRLAAQDGFDRLVFEFDERTPEFQAEFVDPPILERPSGQPVEVQGSAFLEVTMARASGTDLTGDDAVETYTGPGRLNAGGTGVVTEVVEVQDFENFLTWTIGLDERAEYSVETLSSPPRVVIDVRIPK